MSDIVWLTTQKEVEDFCASYPALIVVYLEKISEEGQLFLHHYAADAAQMRQTHPQIKLAAVDEFAHPDAASRSLGLMSIFLHTGDVDDSEYLITDEYYGIAGPIYLSLKTYHTFQNYFDEFYLVRRAHTVERLTKYVFEAKNPVVLQLNLDSDMVYWAASLEVKHFIIDRTLTDLVAQKYGLKIGSDPMWVRVEAGNARVYQRAMDVAEFKEFARGQDITFVVPFTGKEVELAAQYVYGDPADLASMQPTLDALSRKHRDLSFVTVDANKFDRACGLEMGPADMPFFAIDKPNGVFMLKKPTPDAITQFVEDYYAEKLKPLIRSEPEPTEVTNPLKLVGSTMDQAISDTSKTYFIRFFNKQSQEVMTGDWKELAEHFSADQTVEIAEFDLSRNLADMSPGCYLYPVGADNGNGRRVPIIYRFGSEVDRLVDFVNTKGKLWPWVMTIGQDELEDVISTHRIVVVEQYDEASRPAWEFAKAADKWKDSNPDLKFVRVVGTNSSLKLFYEGQEIRLNSIRLETVLVKATNPVQIINTESELWSILSVKDLLHPLVAQLNTLVSLSFVERAVLYHHMYRFVAVHRDLNRVLEDRFHTTIGDLPTVMVIHPQLYGDVRMFSGEMEVTPFEKVVSGEKEATPFQKFLFYGHFPLFGEFESKLQGDKRKAAIYFHEPEESVEHLRKPMEALARLYPQFIFEYALARERPYWRGDVRFMIGWNDPYFLEPERHAGDSEVEAIEACVMDYVVNVLLAQESDREQSPTKHAKGVDSDHSERMLKTFLFHHPKKDDISPLVDEVAKRFADNPNVVFESEERDPGPFPVGVDSRLELALYPALGELDDGGTRLPIKYFGPQNVESLATFITTGSPVVELTAETYADFVRTAKWAVVKHYRSSCPTPADAAFFQYTLDHRDPEHHELLLAQIDLERYQDIDDWHDLGTPLPGGWCGPKEFPDVRVVRNLRRRKCSTSESSASRTMPRAAES